RPGGGRIGGMTLRAFAAATVVLSLGLHPVPAGSAQEPPVFGAGVEVVAVDVSVVDKDGRPVPDLAAGDFTLTVSGRPRRVVSAEFISEAGAPPPDAPETPFEPPTADYSTNEHAHRGRLVLLAVDQGNIPAGGGRATIAAAEKLLDRLGPFDQV